MGSRQLASRAPCALPRSHTSEKEKRTAGRGTAKGGGGAALEATHTHTMRSTWTHARGENRRGAPTSTPTGEGGSECPGSALFGVALAQAHQKLRVGDAVSKAGKKRAPQNAC